MSSVSSTSGGETSASPAEPSVTIEVDAAGNLLSITDPLGNQTTYTYDSAGNPTSVTDPNGDTTTFAYDSGGNLVRLVDPLGNETTFTYDADGLLIREQITVDGVPLTRSYQYDDSGRLIRRVDREGRVRAFTYDDENHVYQEIWYDTVADADADQNRQNTIAWTYDAAGNLLSVTDDFSSYVYLTMAGEEEDNEERHWFNDDWTDRFNPCAWGSALGHRIGMGLGAVWYGDMSDNFESARLRRQIILDEAQETESHVTGNQLVREGADIYTDNLEDLAQRGYHVYDGAVATGELAGTVVTVVQGGIAARGMVSGASSFSSQGTKVYRVWGDGAGPWGRSWTPVNPAGVTNYRSAAGLPSQNTGRFVTEGIITDATGVTSRGALPLCGNKGGIPELVVPNPPGQIKVTRVSGVNPEF